MATYVGGKMALAVRAYNNAKCGKVGVYFSTPTTITICLTTVLLALLPTRLCVVAVLPWLLISDQLYQYTKEERRILVKIVGALILATGHAAVLPLFLAGVIRTSQRGNKGWANRLLCYFEGHIKSTYTGTGSHANLVCDLTYIYEAITTRDWFYVSIPHYLREVGIDKTPMTSAERLTGIEPRAAGYKLTHLETSLRWGLWSISLAFTLALGAYSGAACVVGLIALLTTNPNTRDEFMLEGADTRMREGIYRVDTYVLGYHRTSSIGTVVNGVMHLPYHGVCASTLLYGRTRLTPYYIKMDVVTYGGLPQYVAVQPNDNLVANHEPPVPGSVHGHCSVNVFHHVDVESGEMIWNHYSESGESGSPIFRRNNDGSLDLVGMVGKYTFLPGSDGNDHSIGWFASPAPVPGDGEASAKPGYYEVITHPGSGKTRIKIPQYINDYIRRNPKTMAKIYILGPTRVVAQEIHEALKKKYASLISLAIHDSGILQRPTSLIQITTHSTFLRILEASSNLNMGMIIVDEAHMENTATEMCRAYAVNFAENGGTAICMSATLHGRSDRGSNYAIADTEIDRDDIETTINKHLLRDHKVLVFMPGQAACDDMAAAFRTKDWRALALHRGTYTRTMELVKAGAYDVVFATNIAECGLNMDVDVVVDSGLEYDYYVYGNATVGKTAPCSEASSTQRRGRVGRLKTGSYYFVRPNHEILPTKAYVRDAQILMAGRKWAPHDLAPHGYQLSEAQYRAALTYGLTPKLAYTIIGQTGARRTIREITECFGDEYLHGDVTPPCLCCEKLSKSWRLYDEREHDVYCGIARGSILLQPYDPTRASNKAKLEKRNDVDWFRRIKNAWLVRRVIYLRSPCK